MALEEKARERAVEVAFGYLHGELSEAGQAALEKLTSEQIDNFAQALLETFREECERLSEPFVREADKPSRAA